MGQAILPAAAFPGGLRRVETRRRPELAAPLTLVATVNSPTRSPWEEVPLRNVPRLGGESSSFTELYRNHARAVYQFAFYLSGDPALAEDIVSETFLRIWDSAAVVRGEAYSFTNQVMQISLVLVAYELQ